MVANNSVISKRYVTFFAYRITLYHSWEVLLLLIFIALGILMPLSFPIVIAISLSVSVFFYIVSIRYRFSAIMCLPLTSPIPLCKEIEGDLNNFFSHNSLLIHVICTLKTRYSIKSLRCLTLHCYNDNATLHFCVIAQCFSTAEKSYCF